MFEARKINDTFAAAGQIRPTDVSEIAEQGYTTIINNRPDSEEGPLQPTSEENRRAAEAVGLSYHYLPMTMTPEALTPELVDQFQAALKNSQGPVLAHCKSGLRSAVLWALVQTAREGRDVDTVLNETAQAGFDLSQMRPLFEKSAR